MRRTMADLSGQRLGKYEMETMLSTSSNRRWGDPTTYGTLILVDW